MRIFPIFASSRLHFLSLKPAAPFSFFVGTIRKPKASRIAASTPKEIPVPIPIFAPTVSPVGCGVSVCVASAFEEL